LPEGGARKSFAALNEGSDNQSGTNEGRIEDGSVRHYQVTLRVGFTLEG
jgi:flavin-binding protein dodecin